MECRGCLTEGRSFPFKGSRKRFIQKRVTLEDGRNLGGQVAGVQGDGGREEFQVQEAAIAKKRENVVQAL